MKIGSLDTKNNIFLAPLAGVADLSMRRLCHAYGCGLSFTEMVSAKAFSFGDQKTAALLKTGGLLTGVQLFGKEPAALAAAAAEISKTAPLIDINMGCPAPKIAGNGEGSALMKNLVLAEEIIEAVVASSKVPVTVKMRLGWGATDFSAPKLIKIAHRRGAAAVTVHARFKSQLFSGRADYGALKELRRAADLPVIGNGDIFHPGDALKMKEETGVDAVMIGRGAMGAPWLFAQILELFTLGEVRTDPSPREKIEVALTHIRSLIAEKGERVGICEARKHAAWYIKGFEGAAKARREINAAESYAKAEEILLNLLT